MGERGNGKDITSCFWVRCKRNPRTKELVWGNGGGFCCTERDTRTKDIGAGGSCADTGGNSRYEFPLGT